VQGGDNRCTVNDQLIVPSSDPCGGVGKKIGLQIACSAEAPAPAPITARPGCNPLLSYCNATLPAFVTSVTNAYKRGQKGVPSHPNLTDPRALESATAGGARSIGQLSDVVIIAIDVAVPADYAAHYQLSAYFVDWERTGRSNSVTLMNATDATFSTIAPSQLLNDFGGGAWLVWNT